MNTPNRRESASRFGQCRVILLIAIWLGLLTGLGEVVGLAVQRYIAATHYWFLGPQLLWVTPLIDLLTFLGLGAVLAAAAWCCPRFVSVRITTFVITFLAFVSLLVMISWLSDYAVAILAAGLAFQASALIASHYRHLIPLFNPGRERAEETDRLPGNGPTIPRRQFLVSAGSAGLSVAALAAGVTGSQALSEWRSLSGLPGPKPDAPNVLFVVLDTVRAANTSLFGYPRQTTPQLAKLAKQGTIFSWAISAAPWTLPSHSSMFTGHYTHELTADWTKPFDGTYRTLAEAFSAHGYETAGFVGNFLYLSQEWGLNRGFTHFEAIPALPGQLVVDTAIGRRADQSPHLRTALGYYDDYGRKNASGINDSFLRWLASRDAARPFFAFLNYYDAHAPYLPPRPFDEAFGPTRPRLNPRPEPFTVAWPSSEVQLELNAYDGSIGYLDQNVGLLVDRLSQRDLLRNTLIVVVGDHGEEFNEHGIMQHGSSIYLPAIHVPLLISFGSGVPIGHRIDVPVTLRDLAATIVDLVQLPKSDQFPGQSLARFWDASTTKVRQDLSPLLSELNPAPWALQLKRDPVAKGPMKSLVVEHYHYIRNGDGSEELYDIQNDPWETQDLSRSPRRNPSLVDLRDVLQRALVPLGVDARS